MPDIWKKKTCGQETSKCADDVTHVSEPVDDGDPRVGLDRTAEVDIVPLLQQATAKHFYQNFLLQTILGNFF